MDNKYFKRIRDNAKQQRANRIKKMAKDHLDTQNRSGNLSKAQKNTHQSINNNDPASKTDMFRIFKIFS